MVPQHRITLVFGYQCSITAKLGAQVGRRGEGALGKLTRDEALYDRATEAGASPSDVSAARK